jgi:cell division protein ZapB
LTTLNFLNYSGCMHADLKALEEKLSHLISLCVELRMENSKLKSELTAVKQDTVQLKNNMAIASERIEALMESLP